MRRNWNVHIFLCASNGLNRFDIFCLNRTKIYLSGLAVKNGKSIDYAARVLTATLSGNSAALKSAVE